MIETTVEKMTCSGCGVCEVICPNNAIKIVYTENKTFEPQIDNEMCIRCGKCQKYCSNNYDKRKEEAIFLSNYRDPIGYGVENAKGYFRCKTRNHEQLMRSASGGFVTSFASELLKKSVIDCVVHAERIYACTGEQHYRACISYTVEQLDERRSSIYGPVSYNEVLKTFKNSNKRVLVIGVPCAISSIKNVFEKEKVFRECKLYTIALVCSHNVTGQFVDFVAEYYGVPKDEKYIANLRGKNHNMEDRGSFHLHYINVGGKKIIDEDREKIFNLAWRNYYFAMDACNYCSDLWGREADISCKDCWGKEGDEDRYGSSLVIFRDSFLMKQFIEIKDMELEPLSFDVVRVCEYPSAVYKQKDLINRIEPASGKKHRQNDKYRINSFRTKQIYRGGGIRDLKEVILRQRVKSEFIQMKNVIFNSVVKVARVLRLNRVIKPAVRFVRNIFK